MIKQKEVEISNPNEFEYNGIKCDISFAVKKDIAEIIEEAEKTHSDQFSRLYVKESLAPYSVRVFLNEKDEPVFGMVLYYIDHQDWYKEKSFGTGRQACGNYYPFYKHNGDYCLDPHPYQASICW